MLKSNPNPKNFPHDGFPEGTVAIKLLFTQADLDYLSNSVKWQADIYRGAMPPQTMRLLQIDVAVRDDVSPTGWVFGTFMYHDDAPPFEYHAALSPDRKSWLRVVPLGLMFGRPDPPFSRAISSRCKATVRRRPAISSSSFNTKLLSSVAERQSMSGRGAIHQQSQKITDSGIASKCAESFGRTPRPDFCPSYLLR